MATVALEGTGASISFGTSAFTSDLITLKLPEKVRAIIDTTHLGTVGAMTSKPAKLKKVGAISCEFDHDPNADDLSDNVVENITINYPLIGNQTVPAKLAFSGYVTKQGGEEFQVDKKMTTKVEIEVSGDLIFTAGS